MVTIEEDSRQSFTERSNPPKARRLATTILTIAFVVPLIAGSHEIPASRPGFIVLPCQDFWGTITLFSWAAARPLCRFSRMRAGCRRLSVATKRKKLTARQGV